ncbi:MAG TPA: protein phosphatase 2C domain-containing protein [Polyangiaceae bacterium]|nr:protein phosphatase 2C domain-containing protein [Polyangiaceae bacterium]
MLRSAEGVVVDCATLSDPGRDPGKQTNEDALAIAEVPYGMAAVVCDGMGGHEGGELASRAAVQRILETLASEKQATERLLSVALERAHAEVYALGGDAPIDVRPGSTAVLLVLCGQEAWLSYVGDSRAYRIRARTAERLTRDHSVVEALLAARAITPEAARQHPDANRITRALGIAAEIEPELLAPLRLSIGDAFLLCSDGLTDLVEDSELGELVGGAASPEAACQALIALANDRGGHDNISVAVLRVLGVGTSQRARSTVELTREPAQTVVDGPRFTVAMTTGDSAPPTPNMEDDTRRKTVPTDINDEARRKTVPTLVDPLVLAAAHARPTTLLEGHAPPPVAPPPGAPNQPVIPTVPPRRPTHFPIWVGLGVCALILAAIALWSALR